MNLDIFLFNFTSICAYFTPVQVDLTSNFSFIEHFYQFVFDLIRTVSENFFIPIKFTELQTILLTIFLVIISINLALIGFYWSKYGGVITDRFIRQSMYHFSFSFFFLFFFFYCKMMIHHFQQLFDCVLIIYYYCYSSCVKKFARNLLIFLFCFYF